MRPEPIRLLHFADLHIGIENYGRLDPSTGVNSRVRDFLDRLDEVVTFALENEADLVVFAGDAYKTRDPSPTYQRAFAQRVKRLVDAGVPVVLLVGNHDLPLMPQRASTVDIFHTLAVPNVYVGREEGVLRIQTRRGPVQVAVVPFPIRTRLLAHEEYRGRSLPELDAALQEIVNGNIGALARQIDPEVPAVLVAHLSVAGATYGSERGVMIGRDTVILLSALTDPVWDYVALGHIHRHQSLHNGYPPVVYSGSLERIDFGEEKEPKGFCWVQLRRRETTWRFVEVNARPFVTIEADLRETENPLATLRDAVGRRDIRGAVVRVILRLHPEQEKQVREADVRRLLEGAAFVAGIRFEVERKARLRLGTVRPEELAPMQLLERYLEAKEVPPDHRRELMEAAEEIFGEPAAL
ncbi:MAG: exonuclease SbcCD subunit D [Thermoflexia bacterium]|nr:MAG: exonuclease SbcCD subunit D [Thermoflexia bacterium]